jgi:hypothetical protein
LVPVPGSGGRFQLLGEVLGRHEVLLQEPPPADLLERYAGWALLPANATAAGAAAARNAALGRAPPAAATETVAPTSPAPGVSQAGPSPDTGTVGVESAVDGGPSVAVDPTPGPPATRGTKQPGTTVAPEADPVASAEAASLGREVSPAAAPGAGAGAERVASPAPARASPPPSSAARLRTLLAAPATTAPRLALGYDERQQAVEVTLGAHPQWRGGSSENAAALLATHLLEIACQTDADAWEFAVLDFSDDVRVADTFDAILDLTPHLIEYADGVSAQLKLDDVRQRLEQPASDRAHLTLFVLSNPRETLPDALERVLQAGPAAGVQALVWHAGNATSSPQPGDTVLTLADTPHLRIVGQPARNLQLPTPLTTTEAATLAEPLRQARA